MRYRALILNTQQFKDNDLLIKVLLDTGEKINVKSKAIKKITSRNLTKIEVGNYVEVNLIQGKTMQILTEIRVLNNFNELKTSVVSTATWLILEAIQFLPDLQDIRTFDITIEILTKCNEHSKNHFELISYTLCIFFAELLKIIGVTINFENFANNNQEIKKADDIFVDSGLGFCSYNSGIQIDATTFKVIRFVSDGDFEQLIKTNFSADKIYLSSALSTFVFWFESLVARKLNSYRLFAIRSL